MKVRVIHKGVNHKNANGVEESVPVGGVIEIPGNEIPAWLANKVVPDDGGKVFVANPAGADVNPATGKPWTKKEKEAAAKEAAAAERAELVESAKLLGIEVTDKMTVEEIKAAIENAGK